MPSKNRPTFQKQGPATNCIINGKALGWLSCSAYGMAMLIDAATFGLKRPSGCSVRRYTGDTIGGLTLRQVASVAENVYKVNIEEHVGSNVCSPVYAARQLRAGRKMALQIGTRPLLSTKWRSTRGAINHLVEVNEVRGGTHDVPAEALVYDPAADGRYSWVDQGPSWWPWSLVRQAAAALEPGGEGGRDLGPGKMYAGFSNPPKITLTYGGNPTRPMPDRTTVTVAKGHQANVRSRPTSLAKRYIVDTLPNGRLWEAYQKTKGIIPPGSTSPWWYGDHTGKRWIHASNLSGKGGLS